MFRNLAVKCREIETEIVSNSEKNYFLGPLFKFFVLYKPYKVLADFLCLGMTMPTPTVSESCFIRTT